jgi:hypothetical protein
MVRKPLCIGMPGLMLFFWGTLLWAAEKNFWASKPSAEWTDKQIDKLLKDSPWSKEITLSVETIGSMSSSGAGGRGRGSAGGSGGEEGGGGSGARMGGGADEVPRTFPAITVRWYARPIREALVARFSRQPLPPKDAIDRLMNFNSPYYSVLVEGFPGLAAGGRGRGGRGGAGFAAEQLKESAYLQKKNKEKIYPAEVVLPSQPGESLALRFPRQTEGKETLTLEDKDVELLLKIRDNTYHIKFKLSDMVIKEKLEL